MHFEVLYWDAPFQKGILDTIVFRKDDADPGTMDRCGPLEER